MNEARGKSGGSNRQPSSSRQTHLTQGGEDCVKTQTPPTLVAWSFNLSLLLPQATRPKLKLHTTEVGGVDCPFGLAYSRWKLKYHANKVGGVWVFTTSTARWY